MDRKVVLIVDDESELIRVLVKHLKAIDDSLKIVNAFNGKVALELAEEVRPDLIIMDWDMPVMNGIDATIQLKSIKHLKDIPVIIASGAMITSDNLKTALEAGAMDFIRKPFDYIELEARMNSAMRLYNTQKKVRTLYKENLDAHHRKLSSSSLIMHEKNEVISSMVNSLKLLSSEEVDLGSKEGKKKIQAIIKEFSSHLNVEKSWVEFKMHFDEVHPDFFKYLYTQDLSSRDLKLCAYLKLAMNNKEIASLLHIEPGSIRQALYRLKKKLNLSEEEDLRDYINKLG